MTDLVKNIIHKHGISFLSTKLSVNKGAIKRWIDLDNVPSYYKVDLLKLNGKEVDFTKLSYKDKDQFFTDKNTAVYCYSKLIEVLYKHEVNINDYTMIEPSVGDGSFYNLMGGNKIGIDIEPRLKDVIKYDYLEWLPERRDGKYIVLGNPPFGLRSNMALRFINHSHFADFVAFILPQSFESEGKGSAKKRVKDFNLIHTEKINPDFHYPDGAEVRVNVVFQIWSKHIKIEKDRKTVDEYIKIYSISDGNVSSKKRNVKMIGKCDYYLPSTCFGDENIKLYQHFDDLPNKRGYGIIIHNNQEDIQNLLQNVDWREYSFLSTNGAYNLRIDLIENALISNGVYDKPKKTILSFT